MSVGASSKRTLGISTIAKPNYSCSGVIGGISLTSPHLNWPASVNPPLVANSDDVLSADPATQSDGGKDISHIIVCGGSTYCILFPTGQNKQLVLNTLTVPAWVWDDLKTDYTVLQNCHRKTLFCPLFCFSTGRMYGDPYWRGVVSLRTAPCTLQRIRILLELTWS